MTESKTDIDIVAQLAATKPQLPETVPTASEWCSIEENFALDADELANLAARALKLLVDNPGRTSQRRLLEAMRHLTSGLNDYLQSREPFLGTRAGKVLLADAVGDADNSEAIGVREIGAVLERAWELSRKAREIS